ncbi:hypothetical protein M409DRAFT_28356 [Zasmidium cellare ATCC 36951]|uniref:RING-type domain-containing protein n=1 Tax=Zasmidium cellare ATCC 36951 TaxID=1080233 RepID=A0A6A6C556_ZASCE|nr:uncharacterized protein M409DRAFT_28356 [Zasmidium cellare ATCC 36951]KAF2161320.1 hypothetical protein M409DRAFT_28356 [Zasmidium cellare ATCC 36951]
MSAWDFDHNGGGGGGREHFEWDDEPEWNFDRLDHEDHEDWDEQFALHAFAHSPPPPTHSAFTNTRNAAPPSQRHENNISRSHDTAFLDTLLHATAPARRRTQAVTAQADLTRRHPADPPRDSAATSSRRPFSNSRTHTNHPSHFGYIPSALFDESDNGDDTPYSTQPSTRVSDRASEDFVTLEEDTDGEEGLAAMAPSRRRTTRRESATVDLTPGASTTATSQQRSRVRKRSVDSTAAGEGRAFKRGRVSQEDTEEIDLSKDPPSAEEELLQKQQQEAIKQQHAAEENQGPYKIGKRTCIICMENFTNCTIASCGHFYCHECLIQALIAGEKNSDRGHGTCPQCRKPLTRNTKKKRDIIPLSFMKKETFEKNRHKRLQAS